MQCHLMVRGTITTSAARRARAASSRVWQSPERQPAQWRLRGGHAKPAVRCWRPLLARRTTVLHRRERPPAGAVPFHRAGGERRQRGEACSRGKLACFATSRDTASAVALARRSRECRLCAGDHSSHVVPRSCTDGHRPPADAVPFRIAPTGRNQRGTARARGNFACFATSRDTASAVALARRSHEFRLCPGGHSSHDAPRSCTE